MERIVKHLNDSLAQRKSLCSMRGSCDDRGTRGTVCDQYMVWERKSCEIEINGHITVITWGRHTRIWIGRVWDSTAIHLLGNMLLRRISNSLSPAKSLSALCPVINKTLNGIDINPWMVLISILGIQHYWLEHYQSLSYIFMEITVEEVT